VAVSSRSFVIVVLVSACSVGVGEGTVTGTISAPECGLEDRELDLEPDFYVADVFEERVTFRVQRGGDYAYLSDGLTIFVADSVRVQESMLGTPIPLSAEAGAPVRMNLYMHDTCVLDRDSYPVNYVAVEGEITFDAIYAPEKDEDALETTASFTDVRLVDTSRPDERFAVISGEFSFLFNRGRPAQRFP